MQISLNLLFIEYICQKIKRIISLVVLLHVSLPHNPRCGVATTRFIVKETLKNFFRENSN